MNTKRTVNNENKTKILKNEKYNVNKSSISEKFFVSDLNTLSDNLSPNEDSKQFKSSFTEMNPINPSASNFIEHIVNNHSSVNYQKDQTKDQMFSINSIKSGAFKRRSKSLNKIPFSQVVGVQSKTKNKLSPFMNFSDLIESLTIA